MKRSQLAWLALLLFLVSLFPSPLVPSCSVAQAKEASSLTVYFPNWNVYSAADSQVKDLPWQRLDCIHHAFWKIISKNGGYAIVSTDPWADTDPGNPKAHFPQYERLTRQYPKVRVLLSIGGWTCCGLFSQMALTRESRASFIQSCVDTLQAYPFLSGIDLDWEYPGVARKGSGNDEGNPVAGDDFTNYTLLLRELRAALDAAFGAGTRQITVCAAASTEILTHQDYASLFPYVNRINLMTYDMTGAYNAQTSHHAALFGAVSADSAVKYLQAQGVPAGKIAIGTPLYSHGWKYTTDWADPLYAPAVGLSGGGSRLWRDLQAWESAAVPSGIPGWHTGYDEQAQAAYLWNDDPGSASYRHFYTYENARSLDAKLRYIHQHGLGGIIVWQSGGDDSRAGWPMLTRMYRTLHP